MILLKNKNVKKGDYVARKSYGKDILFNVEKIIKLSNGKENAILKGVIYRIKADSPVQDLCIIDKREVMKRLEKYDLKILEMAKRINQENTNKACKRKVCIYEQIDSFCYAVNPHSECCIPHYCLCGRWLERSSLYQRMVRGALRSLCSVLFFRQS